ncbi:MAG: hypothetical protein LBC82_08850 [Oscillospiraceae bacterium]|jgi:hypothetical protein|nr:hypothetical protein [Oscillospiraceae bacterium]
MLTPEQKESINRFLNDIGNRPMARSFNLAISNYRIVKLSKIVKTKKICRQIGMIEYLQNMVVMNICTSIAEFESSVDDAFNGIIEKYNIAEDNPIMLMANHFERDFRQKLKKAINHFERDFRQKLEKVINPLRMEEFLIRQGFTQAQLDMDEDFDDGSGDYHVEGRRQAYPFSFSTQTENFFINVINCQMPNCLIPEIPLKRNANKNDDTSLNLDHEPDLSIRFNFGEYRLTVDERRMSYNDVTRLRAVHRICNLRKGRVPYNRNLLIKMNRN